MLLSVAMMIAVAAPAHAHADGNDQSFLVALQQAGLTYQDPDRAVSAGKQVCDLVNGGTDMSDVVTTLTKKNTSLNPDKASKFAAIAANAYCPDAVSTTSSASETPSDTPSPAPTSTS